MIQVVPLILSALLYRINGGGKRVIYCAITVNSVTNPCILSNRPTFAYEKVKATSEGQTDMFTLLFGVAKHLPLQTEHLQMWTGEARRVESCCRFLRISLYPGECCRAT